MMLRRALVAVAVLRAGCGGPAQQGPAQRAGEAVILEEVSGTAREHVPSALDRIDDPALPDPLVDPARVISGGPPPDGIPSIDRPRFELASGVEWLAPDEPVLALGDRAYPVQIMIWHEIVNDTIDGRPVAVTYCPLCTSALAFDRRVDERVLTFGTSGKLYLSDLVMYDRQTESLWSQIEGRAIAGVQAGTELERIPVATVPWERWREANPQGWVLSRDTGVDRDYGRNPYRGYDEPGATPFLFDGEPDPRLPPKERVIGLGGQRHRVTLPAAAVAQRRVVEVEVGDTPVVLLATRGLRSALDAGRVAEGREVAATGAFRPELDGRALTFVPDGPDAFRDVQTGSRWTVVGEAVAGPLDGRRLERVEHLDTFWFAWAAFHPDTRLLLDR
jgi:hypothetical protein